MKKRIADIFLICFVLIVLFVGLLRTLIFPKEMNYYENRYAEKIVPITVASSLDGSFQDSVEKALADQIPLAQSMKKAYNNTNSYFVRALLEKTLISEDNKHYVRMGDISIFGDNYIVYNSSNMELLAPMLDERINAYNKIFEKHPETDFYVYYIEKDTDINFETNEKLMAYEYLKDGLNLTGDKMGCFSVNSFDEFSDYFYRTDHHWKAEGSYKGYCDVLELISDGENALVPLKDEIIPGSYSGSKAQGSKTGSYSESFSVYRFDFPEMNVTVNGTAAPDYGEQEAYKTGEKEHPSYGIYYGGDMGEVIFDTGNKDKEDILVIGESFDNAILKLLASHFNRTYSVDLRYYQPYMGKQFRLSDYLSEHNIKKVLFIGNVDYFIMSDFVPED